MKDHPFPVIAVRPDHTTMWLEKVIAEPRYLTSTMSAFATPLSSRCDAKQRLVSAYSGR